jgi:hypothetical protein
VQAWDRYAYTSNNPVLYTDPTGHRNEEDGYEPKNEPINSILTVAPATSSATPRSSTPIPKYTNTPQSTPTSWLATPTYSGNQRTDLATDTPQITPTYSSIDAVQKYNNKYNNSCERNGINWTNMAFDVGSLALDIGTAGIAGRGVEVAKAAKFGYSNLEIGKDLFTLDFSNGNLDWYDYSSTALDVVGLGIPYVPSGVGIYINIKHATQCK